MPGLTQILPQDDIGFLNIIATFWNVELNANDSVSAINILLRELTNPAAVIDMQKSIPEEGKKALDDLLENQGRMPWSHFCRRYGELRVMGAGKRDRERPYLNPISTTEILYFRALIGKAFLYIQPEPQEFAFIPDEFLRFFQTQPHLPNKFIGAPAKPDECSFQISGSDQILDHACTLLVALRSGLNLDTIDTSSWNIPSNLLLIILQSADLVNTQRELHTGQIRKFLESDRANSLAYLVNSWKTSDEFNEIKQLPGLIFNGNLSNSPQQARLFILQLVNEIPIGDWWSLDTFIQQIKEHYPDFQRPAGDYDSWFIRKEGSENFLRGFSSWDVVDGELIRYMIAGPMFWLGLVDLAASSAGTPPSAFRKTNLFTPLYRGDVPEIHEKEHDQVIVKSNGEILCRAMTSRVLRYQIARFCKWKESQPGEYKYQVTGNSLENVAQQGLKPSHLLNLLKKHTHDPLPPRLILALNRWEKFGSQVKLDKVVLLRASSKEVVETIQNSRGARFIKDMIGTDVFEIKPGGEKILSEVLIEAGYLLDDRLEV